MTTEALYRHAVRRILQAQYLTTFQLNLTDNIHKRLLLQEEEDTTTLLILGLMMGLSLVICPGILNAVYNLITDMQYYSSTLANK